MPKETFNDGIHQDTEANFYHDRKYGWDVRCARVYTNIARNPEYVKACPWRLLAVVTEPEKARNIIWDWHNQTNESALMILKEA